MKEFPIPPEVWIKNLLDAAELIADQKGQESRWLAPDAFAWESPDEAINVLDDSALDRFIEHFPDSFSAEQAKAVTAQRSLTRDSSQPGPPPQQDIVGVAHNHS
jgi:hypothetical protein